MPASPAVGVHDDLAPGQPAIPMRPADDEPAGRVDVIRDVVVPHLRAFAANHGANDLLDQRGVSLGRQVPGAFVDDFLGVLRREHDGIDSGRPAANVLDGHLTLGVRSEPLELALLAAVGQPFHESVGQVDRQRHQRGGFVAGEAEHEPLIAGPLFGVKTRTLAYAPRDVAGLAVNRADYGAASIVEPDGRIVVADVAQRLADRAFGVRERSFGFGIVDGHLAGQHDQAGGHERLDGRTGVFVAGQQRIQDGIRDLVSHLVGVAHRHGFRREQVPSLVDIGATQWKRLLACGLSDCGHAPCGPASYEWLRCLTTPWFASPFGPRTPIAHAAEFARPDPLESGWTQS